jgi:serine/threonine-protein kinase HipA
MSQPEKARGAASPDPGSPRHPDLPAPALEELPRVAEADVYKAGRLAGHLLRRSDRVEFVYRAEYVDDHGEAVATTLPLGVEPVASPAGAVPPFFAGLLPEGRRLSALRRAVKTSADDELSILLAVGSDTVGDVQVLPTGTTPTDAAPALLVGRWDAVNFADVLRRSLGVDFDRVALPGLQDKVSAAMIAVPVGRAGQSSILKLSPPEFPHLVENEAFFLRVAREAGLSVVDTEVVHDSTGAPGLLVRRFDRADRAGRATMLAVEDGCQVLGRYPADKYALTAEEVVRGLAHAARATPVAARDLLSQLAFAYLACNGDAHAKNFAVVRTVEGEWRVTPAYDLPCSYVYGGTTMALTIDGKRKEDIGRDSFVALGASAGLPARAVTRVVDELCTAVDGWIDRLDELPFDEHRIHRLRRAVLYRRERLR